MKSVFAVVCAVGIGALLPTIALGQQQLTCDPPCVSGSSCCVQQHSDGTKYGAPYCKAGSCYTSGSNEFFPKFNALIHNIKDIQQSEIPDKDTK
jgi:hypothetical protein